MLRFVFAACFASAISLLFLSSSCRAEHPCGDSCAPAAQYCLKTTDAKSGCKSVAQCEAIPDSCMGTTSCPCLLGDSDPPGHFLYCTFDASGFIVWDDSEGC